MHTTTFVFHPLLKVCGVFSLRAFNQTRCVIMSSLYRQVLGDGLFVGVGGGFDEHPFLPPRMDGSWAQARDGPRTQVHRYFRSIVENACKDTRTRGCIEESGVESDVGAAP